MRFRASTFLVLLVFTFHELPSARCSDATSPRPVDGNGGEAHRRRVVGRQAITEVTNTDVTLLATETITQTGSGTIVIITSTKTAAITAAKPTEVRSHCMRVLPCSSAKQRLMFGFVCCELAPYAGMLTFFFPDETSL